MENKIIDNNEVKLFDDEYEFNKEYYRKIILDTIKDWKMTELLENGEEERFLPYRHYIVHFLSIERDVDILNRCEHHEGIPMELIKRTIRKFTVQGDLLHDSDFDGKLGWSDDSLINSIHYYLDLESDGMIGRGTGMRVKLGLIRDFLIDVGIIKGEKNPNLFK